MSTFLSEWNGDPVISRQGLGTGGKVGALARFILTKMVRYAIDRIEGEIDLVSRIVHEALRDRDAGLPEAQPPHFLRSWMS